jgi:hypothetical protein
MTPCKREINLKLKIDGKRTIRCLIKTIYHLHMRSEMSQCIKRAFIFLRQYIAKQLLITIEMLNMSFMIQKIKVKISLKF